MSALPWREILHWGDEDASWLLLTMAFMDILEDGAGPGLLVLPASLLVPVCSVFPFSFFQISSDPEASIFTWLSNLLHLKILIKSHNIAVFAMQLKILPCLQIKFRCWNIIHKKRYLRIWYQKIPAGPRFPVTHFHIFLCPMWLSMSVT